MFAYIQNNKIFCISSEKLTEEFLQNIDSSDNLTVIEYSDNIQNPTLSEDGKKIIEAPREETNEEKFARIFSYFSNPENPLETEKLEGIKFNDKQIGDLIQARVFEGNPHAESAMQAKFSAWIASVILGKPNNELKAEIDAKQTKINEVREFFSLPPLTF